MASEPTALINLPAISCSVISEVSVLRYILPIFSLFFLYDPDSGNLEKTESDPPERFTLRRMRGNGQFGKGKFDFDTKKERSQ